MPTYDFLNLTLWLDNCVHEYSYDNILMDNEDAVWKTTIFVRVQIS